MPYSDVELLVIEATRDGLVAEFNNGEVVGADLIRRLMLGIPLDAERDMIPAPCGVRIIGAVIDGQLNLNNGRGEHGSIMPGLVLDRCVIAGGIDLSYAQLGKLSVEKSAVSYVRAVRSTIHGEVVANDIGPVADNKPCVLNFYSATIHGDVQVRRSRLRETAEPDRFNATQYALDLRNALIIGNVYVRNVDCNGTFCLALATIRGHLTLRSGRIMPRPGMEFAIFGDDCEIAGTLSLRTPDNDVAFEAYGSISFPRSRLGAANFDGAIVRPGLLEDNNLNLADSRIVGSISFNNGFDMVGMANLHGVEVGYDMLAVKAFFSRGIDGVGLCVGGDLNLSGLRTNGPSLIDLTDAHIARTLCTGDIKADLDLTRARARNYNDFGQCGIGDRLVLDGFSYDRLEILRPGKSRLGSVCKARLKWLGRQGNGFVYRSNFFYNALHKLSNSPRLYIDKLHYRPQPFLRLAHVLSEMGRDRAARDVMRAKQWIEARHEKFLSQFILRIFGAFFGFGYSSARAVLTLALYFVIGWYGVVMAKDQGWLVYDVQPVAAYVQLDATAAGNKFSRAAMPEVSKQNTNPILCKDVDSYSYALDLMIPLIDLHIEGKCEVRHQENEPDPYGTPAIRTVAKWLESGFRGPVSFSDGSFKVVAPTEAQCWRLAHIVYAMLGWVIVSLSILTFSGLLRQKERIV